MGRKASGRQLGIWVLLLALAQVADVGTTAVGMSHGAMEGNVLAASVLDQGGLALFWGMKLMIAACMGLAVILVHRYASIYPGRRALVLNRVLWIGLQLGVFTLTVAAVNNLAVSAIS
jgi:hypothetical protein